MEFEVLVSMSFQEIFSLVLNIIEESGEKSLTVSLNCLFEHIFSNANVYNKQSAIFRRAFFVLNKKLSKLVICDDNSPQMELYESVVTYSFVASLQQFKRNYEKHEM